jgi:hypothetical protein
VKVRAARAIRAILISEGNLMRRLGVSFALLLGTVVAVHAADRITPTCDPSRVPSCWVEHGDSTGPQLVPVEPEQYDLPPPLPPPTAMVPPPPGYYAPPPSALGQHPLPPSSLWQHPSSIWSNWPR